MSEISAFHWACDEGRYHVQPWVIPFVLDPDTSQPLPRRGRADRARRVLRPAAREPLGRHASRATRSRSTASTPCRCGLASVHIAHDIMRYSEKQGVEDDRITCSATQEVHDEARELPAGDRGMSDFRVPLFLRGELVEDGLEVDFGGRGGAGAFEAPDPRSTSTGCRSRARWRSRTSTRSPFDEILDVLARARPRARLREEPRTCRRPTRRASSAANYPASILRNSYVDAALRLRRASHVREIAEARVGIDYLDGWVSRTLRDGRELRIRAFGARALHVPAGNGGLVSAVTIIRNAITRSDAIVKVPSNDPLTALAIARTLADVAPEPPAHEAPRGRLLEGRRSRGRGAALPPRADREDRRLGRLRVREARDALHPAGPRADRARPEAQRHDHRARGVRERRDAARGGAARRLRHRRREPGGLRLRARDLRAVRHRRRRARRGQPARRAHLRGAGRAARAHQHEAEDLRPRAARPPRARRAWPTTGSA